MTRHHLPPEYSRPARAYLAAFLGEREAVDAMHEVAADATYWGDDSLAAVLAVAHGVLLSRLRVTGEAAASWLVDELGLPADIAARVTDTESSFAARASGQRVRTPDEDAQEKPPPAPELPIEPDESNEPSSPVDEPAGTSTEPPMESVTSWSPVPLRIGFDEEPLPFRIFNDPPDGRWRLAAGALLIAGLVLVALLLLSR